MTKQRIEALQKLQSGMTDNQKILTERLIIEAITLEDDLIALHKQPHILVSKKHPEAMKVTAAAKLYKEKLNLYTNVIGRINSIIKDNGAEEDELSQALKEFMQNDDKQQ